MQKGEEKQGPDGARRRGGLHGKIGLLVFTRGYPGFVLNRSAFSIRWRFDGALESRRAQHPVVLSVCGDVEKGGLEAAT